MSERLGWRIGELAEQYGLSETVLREDVHRGRLIAHRMGLRTLVVLAQDWTTYLEATKTGRPRPARRATAAEETATR